MFKRLNVTLKGRIGLKVHSGEKDGIYYLRPDFLQKIYDYTNGTFIECNTAYKNWRHNTSIHMKLAEEHGWYEKNRRFVIMDEEPDNDWNLTIEDGVMIKENIVGEHLKEYDSCIVLAHFKGHMMGGYGGALKQLSIGFASSAGKANIHTAGVTSKWQEMKEHYANQKNFTAAMGDAASSIVKYFKNKGDIVFINVIVNVSKVCDCGGGSIVPPPKIHDIGILASKDPVAIDRAALDMVKATNDEGTDEWLAQMYRLEGVNTIYVAESHGIGTQDYNIIDIDKEESYPYPSPYQKYSPTLFEWVVYIIIIVLLLLIIVFAILNCVKRYKSKSPEVSNEDLPEPIFSNSISRKE